jgi:hypothetical protein
MRPLLFALLVAGFGTAAFGAAASQQIGNVTPPSVLNNSCPSGWTLDRASGACVLPNAYGCCAAPAPRAVCLNAVGAGQAPWSGRASELQTGAVICPAVAPRPR